MGRERLLRILPAVLLLLALGLATAFFLYYSWRVIWFPYPVDYGEGPLLDQTARLARFEGIYRSDLASPPYTVSNYPPVYMALQTPLMWLLGPAYWYGRLLSWLSVVAAATLIGSIVNTFTRDRLASLAAGLTLVAIPYVSFWAPLYRVDALALALSLGALLVIVRRPEGSWSVPVAALLLTAAIYTRQSYALAAPLTALVWLWSAGLRRRALVLALALGGSSLGLFLLLNLVTDGGFFFNVVTANANELQGDRLARAMKDIVVRLPVLLLIFGSVTLLGRRFDPRYWRLIVGYGVTAALAGLTIAKIGANVNYLLELCAALSLATGYLLAWQRARRPRVWAAAMLLLAAQIVIMSRGSSYHDFTVAKLGQTAELDRLMRVVRRTEGNILADEYLGLLPLDGRAIRFQPFEMSQLAYAGLWDQAPLLEAIDRQRFSAVLIYQSPDYPGMHRTRWTWEMLDVVERRYEIVNVLGDTAVFLARQ